MWSLYFLIVVIFLGGFIYLIVIATSSFDSSQRTIVQAKKQNRKKYAQHGLRCYSLGLNSGERRVVKYLSKFLDTRYYYLFNNIILETDNGSTQIDHIVVSVFGIFVIETKDYSGWIFANKYSKKWTQTLPGNNKFSFQNPYRQNYKHIVSLQKYFPFLQRDFFKTIIAFSYSAEFKTDKPEEVKYFDEITPYIKSFKKPEISRAHFFMIVGKLSQLCQSTDISPEEHVVNLQREHLVKN